MIFREAQTADIKQLLEIDIIMSAGENLIPAAGLITGKEYEELLTVKGKGWLCEVKDRIVGVAIVDLMKNNIRALFVNPQYEAKGIGKKLQNIILNWYFTRAKDPVWLGADPNTRAEAFFLKYGWKKAGIQPNGKIKFQLTFDDWKNNREI